MNEDQDNNHDFSNHAFNNHDFNNHDFKERLDLEGVANESDIDPEAMDESGDSEVDEGQESLPFGMSGVTGLLQRLAAGIDDDAWPQTKQRMVAGYLLDLSNVYWMNHDEIAFCKRVAAA